MTLDQARQKSILRQVLLWNLALFAGLGAAGWMADSSALLANAVDNGSDAAVYLLSYLAIDRRPAWKRGAAAVSGVMLLLFAVAVMADVVRRWLYGAEPLGPVMMGLALVAAAINLWCLVLMKRQWPGIPRIGGSFGRQRDGLRKRGSRERFPSPADPRRTP